MTTRRSTVAFENAFTLNGHNRWLPAGTYEIEIDEEEIQLIERIARRRTAIHVFVHEGSSTRTIAVTPGEFDAAIERYGRANP